MELTIEQALQQGIDAHKEGKIKEAEHLYRAILKSQPTHPDANHNLGLIAVSVNKAEAALPLFKTALEANSKIEQFWLSYIDALIKEKQFDNANQVLEQAKKQGVAREKLNFLKAQLVPIPQTENSVSENPSQQQLNSLLEHYQNGRFGDAEKLAISITHEFPRHQFGWKVLGAVLGQTGRKIEAANANQKSVELSPQDAGAHNNLGNTLRELGRLEESEASLRHAIALKPDYAKAHNNLANTLKELGRLDEAEASYKQAIALKSDYAEAHINLGATLQELGRLDEAELSYSQAIALKPDFPGAHYNLGNTLKVLERLNEAEASYTQAIALKPDYVKAHNNLGLTLQELGRLDEAEASYAQAIALKPDYAQAHYNLANTLKELNRLNEAEASYTQAMALKSDYAEAHINLGATLQELGRLDEAEASYKQAIKINPDCDKTYNNIGSVLYDNEKIELAINSFQKGLSINPENVLLHTNLGVAYREMSERNLENNANNYKKFAFSCYMRAIEINPKFSKAYVELAALLENQTFEKHEKNISKIIFKILGKNLASPYRLAVPVISLIKTDPNFVAAFELYQAAKFENNLEKIIIKLSKIPLFLKFIKTCPLPDIEIEKFLADLRSLILHNLSQLTNSKENIDFINALALQCFVNEYIYNEDDNDKKALYKLESYIKESLGKKEQPRVIDILCLATFSPLSDYSWTDFINKKRDLAQLWKLQISNIKREDEIRSQIPILRKIIDPISSKVAEQYEQFPYPRWIETVTGFESYSISDTIKYAKIKVSNSKICEYERPQVLVAGCGTGQHAINTASFYKNCEVLAIDLSLNSLSYAKRQAQDLGIENIEFLQADILDLDNLDRQFHIIESLGTLHHMCDPMLGWKVLSDCLSVGGLMRISLYSKLARLNVTNLRNQIRKENINSDIPGIKSFRNYLMGAEIVGYENILESIDFFSLSAIRDLLFHEQEHQFTQKQIKKCLFDLNLEFCGYQQEPFVTRFRVLNQHLNDDCDLDKWHDFEEKYPFIFGNTPAFWCQKI